MVVEASIEEYEDSLRACAEARKLWMQTPAPKRGEIVRQIGDVLRSKLDLLGRLVSLEMGKILVEWIGEVQESIEMYENAQICIIQPLIRKFYRPNAEQ